MQDSYLSMMMPNSFDFNDYEDYPQTDFSNTTVYSNQTHMSTSSSIDEIKIPTNIPTTSYLQSQQNNDQLQIEILKQISSLTQQIESLTTKLANKPNKKPESEKAERWSEHEHQLFIQGLKMYGKANFKLIQTLIPTKTTRQVASHSQKFFMRLERQFVKHRSVSKEEFVRLINLVNCLDQKLLKSAITLAAQHSGQTPKFLIDGDQKAGYFCLAFHHQISAYDEHDTLFMMQVVQKAIQMADQSSNYEIILDFVANKFKLSKEMVLLMIYSVFIKIKDEEIEQLMHRSRMAQNKGLTCCSDAQ